METLHRSLPLRPWLRLVHNKQDRGPKCGPSTEELRDERPDLEVRLGGSGEPYSLDILPGNTKAYFRYAPSQRATLPKSLAASVSDIFSGEVIAHLLNINSLVSNHAYQDALPRYSAEAVRDVETQMGRAAKISPQYYATFSLFSAGGSPSSWDIQKALDKHVLPLVYALRKTTKIELGTQVQLFSSYSPSIQPKKIEGAEGNFLEQKDLTSFVNAAEWPLSPSVGHGPTLNFIAYVPSKNDVPLGVVGSPGGAWLVPQWGGISILNLDVITDHEFGSTELPSHVPEEKLASMFETFSTQLLALLGVPTLKFDGPVAERLLPLDFRLQAHQRISALHLHLKAASSLASLARLAKHLHTIPIPKHVSQLVENTMSNLTASDAAMLAGNWDAAIEHASLAYADSEKAFFDKSMVGQVYFPDEHKVAVYLPFLGPIAVPLVVSLLREIKRFLEILRARRKKSS
jgi:GPI-anchor transamidase subunit S